MGIFNFNRKEVEQPVPAEQPKVNYSFQNFGVPIIKIGGDDITKPYINGGYYNREYIPFGSDNLYPSILDNLYYQSPLHSAIIDYQVRTAIGGGFEIIKPKKTTGERINEKVWIKQNSIKKMLKGIAMDLKIHNRVHILVHKNDEGVVNKIERLLPASVRYNIDKTYFYVSPNWLGTTQYRKYPEYSFGSKDPVSVWSYIDLESSPGQDIYPLPNTVSANNWIFLDGESSYLQKKNIQKSIFGNLVIRRPKSIDSVKEYEEFMRGIQNKEGEVLSALVLAANGFDNVPEVTSFPVNQNDKAFSNLYGRIDDKICQSHSINKILMGIQESGKLGSGSDILAAAPIWFNNVVVPFKEQIEYIMDSLLLMSNIDGDFTLNENKLYDEEILNSLNKGMVPPEEPIKKEDDI